MNPCNCPTTVYGFFIHKWGTIVCATCDMVWVKSADWEEEESSAHEHQAV